MYYNGSYFQPNKLMFQLLVIPISIYYIIPIQVYRDIILIRIDNIKYW